MRPNSCTPDNVTSKSGAKVRLVIRSNDCSAITLLYVGVVGVDLGVLEGIKDDDESEGEDEDKKKKRKLMIR